MKRSRLHRRADCGYPEGVRSRTQYRRAAPQARHQPADVLSLEGDNGKFRRGMPERALVPDRGRCAGDHRKLTARLQLCGCTARRNLPWLSKCGKQKPLRILAQPRLRRIDSATKLNCEHSHLPGLNRGGSSLVTLHTRRLTRTDRVEANQLFELMAKVFSEEYSRLDDHYLEELLSRKEFWAIAALAGDEVIGGLTAHLLPMTRTPSSELFIYDIAVRADHRRQGIGRSLITTLREQVSMLGIKEVFVAADNADIEALDFYRALGGKPSSVTIFAF